MRFSPTMLSKQRNGLRRNGHFWRPLPLGLDQFQSKGKNHES